MHDMEATIPAFDLVVREQTIRGSFAYTERRLRARRRAAGRAAGRVPPADAGPARWRRARSCSRELVAGTTGGFVKALAGAGERHEVRAAPEAAARSSIPGGGHEGLLDVAISRGRIAAVERGIPAESAVRVVDASGQIVTPGLVDLHAHVFHKLTYWGLDPDPIASRTGVTTWNDAGSAGALTVEGFREFIVAPGDASGSPAS